MVLAAEAAINLLIPKDSIAKAYKARLTLSVCLSLRLSSLSLSLSLSRCVYIYIYTDITA